MFYFVIYQWNLDYNRLLFSMNFKVLRWDFLKYLYQTSFFRKNHRKRGLILNFKKTGVFSSFKDAKNRKKH